MRSKVAHTENTVHSSLWSFQIALAVTDAKNEITLGFTYVIIIGGIITLVGQVLYFSTHPFTLVIEQPKLHYFAFGILGSFFFYRIGSGLQPQSAKKVWYLLSIAAALRTVSYLVNSYVSAQPALGLFLYLSVIGAEIAILYYSVLHLKLLRSADAK